MKEENKMSKYECLIVNTSDINGKKRIGDVVFDLTCWTVWIVVAVIAIVLFIILSPILYVILPFGEGPNGGG